MSKITLLKSVVLSVRSLLLFVCILAGQNSMVGQQAREYAPSLPHLEKNQLTASAFAPGLHYEAGLIGSVSFSTAFSPGFSTQGLGNSLGYAVQTRIRVYTNLNSRFNNNKNVSGNSGDYVALANSVFFGDLQITGNFETPENFTFAFNGALYGVQRTYERGFNFNAEMGVGYYQSNAADASLGVLLNLSFGWVLTNRRQ